MFTPAFTQIIVWSIMALVVLVCFKPQLVALEDKIRANHKAHKSIHRKER